MKVNVVLLTVTAREKIKYLCMYNVGRKINSL